MEDQVKLEKALLSMPVQPLKAKDLKEAENCIFYKSKSQANTTETALNLYHTRGRIFASNGGLNQVNPQSGCNRQLKLGKEV